MLRVTPIYGSRFDTSGAAEAPSCTLVEYGGVKVLWNVGWWGEAEAVTSSNIVDPSAGVNPFATQAPLNPFPKIPDHDVLIVSDSTLNSLGGLPLYYKEHWKKQQQEQHRQIPMYATFPSVKMGQMTLYDYHASISLDGGRPTFTMEEMDDAFAQLQTIKYSQTVPVRAFRTGEADDQKTTAAVVATTPTLSITAHHAGHVVGGAFFVLRRLQDDTVVVLTPPTYNIAKEIHLDSSTLLKYGATPDVLVTYPGGPAMKYICKLYDTRTSTIQPVSTSVAANTGNGKSRLPKKKDIMKIFNSRGGTTKHLLETILSVLRRDGHVLLPVDASGRVLEIVLFLSQHWDRQRLGAAYNLVWLGPMVKNTLDFCRSQLEWMASQLGNQFDDGNTSNRKSNSLWHPYALRNVHLCSSVQELDAVIRQNSNNPTCVLASGLTLDHGPARDLFLRWADNSDNAIIFTDSSRCFQRKQYHHHLNYNQNVPASSPESQEDDTKMKVDGDDKRRKQQQRQQQHFFSEIQHRSPSALQRQTSSGLVVNADTVEHDDADGNDNTMMVGSTLGPDEVVSKFCAAAQLLQQWCNAKWEGREMDDSILVDVQVPNRSPLAGQELKIFLAQEEAKRLYQKQQEEKRAMLREVEIAKGQLHLGEDEPSNVVGDTSKGPVAGKGKFSASIISNAGAVNGRPQKKSRFDSGLFLKFSKPLHLSFEVREEAVGVGQSDSTARYGIGESIGHADGVLEDDYGIAVKPERFTDIVSGVDPSKFAGSSGRIGEEVVRRGFGYGASVGLGGKSGSVGGGGSNTHDDDAGDLEDEMDEQALEAHDLSEGTGIIRGRNGRTPTKVTTVPRRLEVLAEIAYVPLEGRVDARAARQSVRALQPRQVIVLGGKKVDTTRAPGGSGLPLEVVDEVSILAAAAQTFASDHSVCVGTPADGESVELSVGHNAYAARLVDVPYQTRDEKQSSVENGISFAEPIEPAETKVGSCTASLLNVVATGQKVAQDGSIVLAPRALSKVATMRRPPVYVSDGEVLLTDLRSELMAQGMKADYSTQAGFAQLVVNGKILVKKGQESQQLDIEGPLCEDFFTVRGIVRGQFVTL